MADGYGRLTKKEKDLIASRLPFYQSIASGERRPSTDAQRHFLAVAQGKSRAKTTDEVAFLKWRRAHREEAESPRNAATGLSSIPSQGGGVPQRRTFTVRLEGTDYKWTGKEWVNSKTHICPPKMLVKRLEAKARPQFDMEDENITDFDELLSSARSAKSARQFRRACKLAQRAVLIASDSFGANAVLCACLRSINEPQRAIDSTAHLSNSNYGPLLVSRAAAYCDLNEWERAKDTIGRVLAKNAGSKEEAFFVVDRIKSARPDLYS